MFSTYADYVFQSRQNMTGRSHRAAFIALCGRRNTQEVETGPVTQLQPLVFGEC